MDKSSRWAEVKWCGGGCRLNLRQSPVPSDTGEFQLVNKVYFGLLELGILSSQMLLFWNCSWKCCSWTSIVLPQNCERQTATFSNPHVHSNCWFCMALYRPSYKAIGRSSFACQAHRLVLSMASDPLFAMLSGSFAEGYARAQNICMRLGYFQVKLRFRVIVFDYFLCKRCQVGLEKNWICEGGLGFDPFSSSKYDLQA